MEVKTLIILLIALTLSAEEFYLQEDKQKHFVGSMAISGTATAIAKHYGSNDFEAIAIGIASSLLVGIAKEAVDGRGYGIEDVVSEHADTI